MPGYVSKLLKSAEPIRK